jgi:lipoprotein-releasing system permease protein
VTALRVRLLVPGVVLALGGLCGLLAGLVRADILQLAGGDLPLLLVGAGPFLELLAGVGSTVAFPMMKESLAATLTFGQLHQGLPWVQVSLAAWFLGWGLIAASYRAVATAARVPSAAVGSPLYPRLAQYKDFYWGTLAAYGFGVLLAEVVFLGAYLLMVSPSPGPGQPAGTGGLPAVWAFVWALLFAASTSFAGGFLGAANSKRLSTPEATIALLYFGLPIPVVLTAMHHVSALMLKVGYRLREVIYLSSLLGDARPELGYWLIFGALALALFLGINFGFVATSSGRLDLRTSYEMFVASRHVAVFRWRLLLGAFGVLILGILPPLILFAIVSAAEAAVERTRVRKLGLEDPLLAAEALNELKSRAQTPTAMMTALSVGGVGVGVMALIIVLSVMSGFEADLQKKILGTNAHGVVLKYTPEMPEYLEAMQKIEGTRGLAGQTPFIVGEVMVSSEANISGAMIKGIDPQTVGSVTDLAESVMAPPDSLAACQGVNEGAACRFSLKGTRFEGRCHANALESPMACLPSGAGLLYGLEQPELIGASRLTPSGGAAFDDHPADGTHAVGKGDIIRDPLIDAPPPSAADDVVLPGLIVGRELALNLKVVVGDRVNVVSPIGGELGPQGPMPKSRPFRVAGIFYSGMFEYDSKFVYIHLKEAQSFFGVKGATGLEVKVTDVDNARGVMKSINDTLGGYPFRVKDWGEMNRNLFAALRLEKLVMGIILSIIVIVAAGLIVATVIMLVLEKRKEIAVLKALGVSDGGIVKIFLSEGLQIGVAGGLLGLVAGLAWCLFIERVGIKLDPQVYYIPALPVRIEPFQTALSVVIAVLVTFLASIYPALKASQVEPVDGLKSE